MFRRNILVIALLLQSLDSLAQETDQVETQVPEIAIKVSPLHLINFYPTFQLAVEKRIKQKLTTQIDLGYVVKNKPYDPDFINMRGYKVKAEARQYFLEAPYRKRALYGAFELYRNSVNFDRIEWNSECMDPECTSRFRRRYDFEMKYRENGFSLKCGFVFYAHRFLFDINSGWGIRFIDYTKPERTPLFPGAFPGFGDETEFFSVPNESDRIVPTPILGLRLGYRLR